MFGVVVNNMARRGLYYLKHTGSDSALMSPIIPLLFQFTGLVMQGHGHYIFGCVQEIGSEYLFALI